MEQQFFAVDIAVFRTSSKNISFDVYLKLSETNYAHIFSKATGIDFQRLNHYRDKGVKNFYVRQQDEPAYNAYIAQKPESVIHDPKASDTKKAAALLSLAEQNLTELFSSLDSQVNLPAEATAGATKLVKSFAQSMAKDPHSLSLMLRVAAHGDYLYYHSLSVSVISMFIAKASGAGNMRLIEVCGLGGLLHDIGYAQLSKEMLESPAALTAAQWREMRQHTNYALKMVEGLKQIPDEVRFILAQHHEEPRGTGYPAGLRGPVIFHPAKIVALADSFCALITNRPFRKAYSVEQALNIIKHDNGKWDVELIKCLVQIFQPKVAQQAA